LEDQLIQVTAGAAVTFEERSAKRVAGMGRDRAQITLTKPIVARLSKDILREVKVSTLFIETPPVNAASIDKVEDEPLSLSHAWEKVAALVTNIPPPDAPPPDLKELERQGMALGISAKRLRLLAPAMNTVVLGEEWPVEVKVVWMRPTVASTNMRFHVYAWPAGSARSAPAAETRQDFYTVRLRRPGAYFVQVTSSDGAWQSMAHSVHAAEPAERATAKRGRAAQVFDASEIVPLESPPDHFMVVGRSAPEAITFAWSPHTPVGEAAFELSIANADTGKEVRRHKVTAYQVTIPLPPGRYLWSVGQVGARRRSDERALEIVDPKRVQTIGDRRALMRQVIRSGKSAAVALEDGI
jgi:hypothetical protein